MKRLLPLLLAAMMLLAGCMDAEEEEASPDVPVDPDEPVLTSRDITLTVWTDPGAGVDFINQAAELFNQRYPNITVQAVGVDSADMAQAVWAESASGARADLFIVPHTDVRQLAEALFVLPARDQTRTRNAVFPASAQAATVGGVLYGYPVTTDTAALFYNKRLIEEEELPETWEDLLAFARGFGGEERHGLVMNPQSAHIAASFLGARGNRPFGPGGDDPEALNLDTHGAIEGMTIFKELRGAAGLSSEELADAERIFASGRAALCITGSWSVGRFLSAGMDFGVVPLPALMGEETALTSLAFSRVMLVNAYSEHPDEASWFAWQLLSEEMQTLRMELTGELPSVELAVRSPPYAAGFIGQLAVAYAAPSVPGASAYWSAFGDAAARIWDGGDVRGELSAAIAELRPAPEITGEED
ncbi:MAG: extracellular solute-binding protein [Oscillospiraceae bacterium]|nr:extracellular solute-binding protein [Oscillospiraceae bacterium]